MSSDSPNQDESNQSEPDQYKLAAVLADSIEGFMELVHVERLSGGASQETYRLEIDKKLADGTTARVPLCLRRAAGGLDEQSQENAVASKSASPGLRTEASLDAGSAISGGSPEPEVYCILDPEHQLGAGFIMEWLEGETLGARIVRLPELEEIRPQLARQCGEVLGRTARDRSGRNRPARAPWRAASRDPFCTRPGTATRT